MFHSSPHPAGGPLPSRSAAWTSPKVPAMAPPPVVARCCWAPSGDPASPGRVRHTSR